MSSQQNDTRIHVFLRGTRKSAKVPSTNKDSILTTLAGRWHIGGCGWWGWFGLRSRLLQEFRKRTRQLGVTWLHFGECRLGVWIRRAKRKKCMFTLCTDINSLMMYCKCHNYTCKCTCIIIVFDHWSYTVVLLTSLKNIWVNCTLPTI